MHQERLKKNGHYLKILHNVILAYFVIIFIGLYVIRLRSTPVNHKKKLALLLNKKKIKIDYLYLNFEVIFSKKKNTCISNKKKRNSKNLKMNI